MTGEVGVRKAEDVGGQELSYAEVKAIASGNPAVLTLAEADAELQRLAVLKKNHTDEQYLARRRLKELPAQIERLMKRLEHLEADITISQSGGERVILGGRTFTRDNALEVLAAHIDQLPEKPSEPSQMPFGVYRGLRFGMVLHPNFPPDVYCEAQTRHRSQLGKNTGPRAVLNALDRLIDGLADEVNRAQQDLHIAESQLRDYQDRVGSPFPHVHYLDQLSRLRDELRQALAGKCGEAGDQPDAAEVAGRIKSLKAGKSLDLSASRLARSGPTAEVPVTQRIRDRADSPPARPRAT